MLTLESRIDTYLTQNGSKSRLTFPQDRRLRKAAKRQAKAARALDVRREEAAADFEMSCAPLADWERELLNQCPRCKVTGDDSCVTPAGKATKTHKGRGE